MIAPPPEKKRTEGVLGGSGDKDLIRKTVKELDIEFCQPQDLDKLDQHAIDSIAVGYCGLLKLEED